MKFSHLIILLLLVLSPIVELKRVKFHSKYPENCSQRVGIKEAYEKSLRRKITNDQKIKELVENSSYYDYKVSKFALNHYFKNNDDSPVQPGLTQNNLVPFQETVGTLIVTPATSKDGFSGKTLFRLEDKLADGLKLTGIEIYPFPKQKGKYMLIILLQDSLRVYWFDLSQLSCSQFEKNIEDIKTDFEIAKKANESASSVEYQLREKPYPILDTDWVRTEKQLLI
jgi:hypothetical protein